MEVTLKIAGVHWYYAHPSHAAELTAGYHNTEQYNGYRPIVEMCARRGVGLTLTCVEMRDQDHAPDAFCSPKRLIRLVRLPPSPGLLRYFGGIQERGASLWTEQAEEVWLSGGNR